MGRIVFDEKGNEIPSGTPEARACVLRIATADLEKIILKTKIRLLGKKVLDLGLGSGGLFECLCQRGADAYGFDIKPYSEFSEVPGRTFFTDVRNISPDLLGTSDFGFQLRYLVPDELTPSVMETVAKALHPKGAYIVTFIDEHYQKPNSVPMKTLRKLFKNIKEIKMGGTLMCVATEPRVRVKEKNIPIAKLKDIEPCM